MPEEIIKCVLQKIKDDNHSQNVRYASRSRSLEGKMSYSSSIKDMSDFSTIQTMKVAEVHSLLSNDYPRKRS